MLKRTSTHGAALALLASLTAAALPSSPAGATSTFTPVTALVSANPSAAAGKGTSTESSVTTGGRYVAFASTATDLVAGDTNAKADVFVRDTLTATTVRVSVTGAGAQADGASDQPSISRDGRYVAFRSTATNLVPGDTNGVADVFVRDLRNRTTTRVSVAGGSNAQATGPSAHPKISAGGLQIAFESTAPNLLPTDTNGVSDVFVRDNDLNTLELVSETSAETGLAQASTTPAISGNGRFVVFTSMTNQIGTFTDSYQDVFLRDRSLGTTERVSLAGDNTSHPNGLSIDGSVSDDGRYVAFESMATNLTMFTDAPGVTDVFVRDRTTSTTDLVDRSTASVVATAGGSAPVISGDGTKVAFLSSTANLVSGDTNGTFDAFVRNLTTNATSRVSTTTSGAQLTGSASLPAVSSDGVAVSFASTATNTSTTDTNSTLDVFVRSRIETGPFAQSSAFVTRTLKDFTGATPSAATVSAVNAKLLNGTATPASTINAYAHGTFDDHRGPVLRLYWAFFKRAPDLGGVNYWAAKHAAGTSLKTIANAFATSAEFKTNFGGGTDTQFITLVYTNVLDRQPDAAGLAHWVALMKTGTTHGEMMANFSESAEGVRLFRGEVDTVLVFLGMLHRVPTSGEVISDANALELGAGQPTEVLIQVLLTGGEYAAVVA